MTLIQIGRSIIDNDLSFLNICPVIDKLIKIPVMFSFPGRKITLHFPTPLILAVYLNRPEVVRFILSHDNDPDFIHKPSILFLFFFNGYSALHIAALLNDADMIDLLVKHNANVNNISKTGI